MRQQQLKRAARRGMFALPFGLGGLVAVEYGDQTSNSTLRAVGLGLFAVGFIWLAFWSMKGLVDLVGAGPATTEVERQAQAEHRDQMVATFVRALPALPFGGVGLFLAGRGDQISSTPMMVIGLVLFLIGFVWIAVCSIMGMRNLMRD